MFLRCFVRFNQWGLQSYRSEHTHTHFKEVSRIDCINTSQSEHAGDFLQWDTQPRLAQKFNCGWKCLDEIKISFPQINEFLLHQSVRGKFLVNCFASSQSASVYLDTVMFTVHWSVLNVILFPGFLNEFSWIFQLIGQRVKEEEERLFCLSVRVVSECEWRLPV